MSLGNDPAELSRRTEPETRDCFVCGEPHKDEMDTIDVSGEDEYYPEIRYLCPVHAAEKTE
jgi:hypothetical protein